MDAETGQTSYATRRRGLGGRTRISKPKTPRKATKNNGEGGKSAEEEARDFSDKPREHQKQPQTAHKTAQNPRRKSPHPEPTETHLIRDYAGVPRNSTRESGGEAHLARIWGESRS
jgi:hypothetical protein